MQKDIFQIIANFDQLLENKTFDELDISEKEMVLQHITPEEYEQYRNAFFMLKAEIKLRNKLIPDTDMKASLMQAFDQKYSPKADNVFMRMINYKMPVYQIGIAAALILAFVWFGKIPAEKIKYVNTRDTVYIEKPVYTEIVKEQPIVKENSSTPKKPLIQTAKKQITIEKPNNYKEYMANNILSKMQSVYEMKRGKNIGKDSVLLAWITPAR